MNSDAIHNAMQRARRHQQAGEVERAEAVLREIVAANPDFADGWQELGILLAGRGDAAGAVSAMQRCVSASPNNANYHSNLGEILRRAGQIDAAVASCRRAVELAPSEANALFNLATALQSARRFDEAIDVYNRLLTIQPDDIPAVSDLAGALHAAGREDEAIAAARRVVAAAPNWMNGWFNLGVMLRELQRYPEAAECFGQAIALGADPVMQGAALKNLAVVQEAMHDFNTAADSLRRALQCRPDDAEAWNNLGNLLAERGQLAEGAEALRQAIKRNPGYASAYSNLSAVLRKRGEVDLAVDAARQSVALRPGAATGLNNLGLALWDCGDLENATATLRAAAAAPDSTALINSNSLLSLHSVWGASPESIRAEHDAFARRYALPVRRDREYANDMSRSRRPRIGYVSPDFRTHSVAYFFEPLISHHNHEQFEIFCYSDVLRADATTARIRSYADAWRDTRDLHGEELGKQIEADRIDILVDLAGHTADNRLLLFSRQPAPVQATYLGYPGTTGLPTMQWRITDAIADPPGFDAHYVERLWRLPRPFLCYAPPEDAPEVRQRDDGPITFVSFNTIRKLSPRLIELWARVMRGVPESRMIIKSAGLGVGSVREWLLDLFARNGIAVPRIDLIDRVPSPADHLATYLRGDIALDSFPYNGTTTTCEALWMGLPVVTMSGDIHASRVGESLLAAMDLHDFVGTNEASYVQIATELAGSRDRLNSLRLGMRERMSASALMDAAGFARAFEDALQGMWADAISSSNPG